MNVSIAKHLEEFVNGLVAEGRYASASEVVQEGLRLVEEQESKVAELRRVLNASIERGGSFTDEEVEAAIEDRLNQEFGEQLPR